MTIETLRSVQNCLGQVVRYAPPGDARDGIMHALVLLKRGIEEASRPIPVEIVVGPPTEPLAAWEHWRERFAFHHGAPCGPWQDNLAREIVVARKKS